MQITVTTAAELIFSIEVAEDMELENFKALCQTECGIDPIRMTVIFEGNRLQDNKKDLKSYGIKNGDMILVEEGSDGAADGIPVSTLPPVTPNSNLPPNMNFNFGSIRIPSASSSSSTSATAPTPLTTTQGGGSNPAGGASRDVDPGLLRDMFLSNPAELSALKETNPRLAEALAQSQEEFTKVLRQQQREREEMRMRMLIADPFDMEAQTLIAQQIQQQNIESNYEAAIEYHPESYGQVNMLYINCKVNGHPVKAFVDSGAQSTIMSNACAERCNIVRLIDNRWSGIAKGVGTQRIIGRIHLGQVQIENDFLASSFTILQDQPMDMLLGLDMLKRHQCSIDLKRNILSIGTTGTETKFLNESEIPVKDQ